MRELEHADPSEIERLLARPTPDRLLIAAEALRQGFSIERINAIAGFDPWFLERLAEIVAAEEEVRVSGLPTEAGEMRRLKAMGFADARLAELSLRSAHVDREMSEMVAAGGGGVVHSALRMMTGGVTEAEVRAHRVKLGVRPVFKRIDSCAAEFDAATPYLYSTYEAPLFGEAEDEADVSDRRKVMILGGGPNRIGQGIEFDYCCCHAAFALRDAGLETIMVNCNPETVSTDPDTSDRLYFEPLTAEDVLEIARRESESGELLGVIVQLGGQTPLKLAAQLQAAGVPILGTSPDNIDLAEDRERFAKLVGKLGLKQPANGIARSRDEALNVAERIGYPVLLRPSYVLGGRGMEVVDGPAQLDHYIATAVAVSGNSPVLIDRYLRDAIEVDVDAICDGEDVAVAGVLQHIEEAGVHSGDSACAIPPHSLAPSVIAEIERQTKALGLALKVRGLMNIQFAVKGEEVYLIEVNPRASRTVPFVAKATGVPIAKIAARVMAGEKLSAFGPIGRKLDYIAVKGPVFPFARFPGRGPGARAGNEEHRRSHGPRRDVRHCIRQGAAGRRHGAATGRDGIRVGQGQRQGAYRPGDREAARAWFFDHRHRGHGDSSAGAGAGRGVGQQSRSGAAAHRRPPQRRRCRFGVQHHRGVAVAEGQPFDPRHCACPQGALLHYRGGKPGRGAGDRGGARPRA